MDNTTEERGVEKLMDDYLKSIGLHRKKIAKDGSCLFRAVAEQVLHSQSLHTTVRAKCVEFLKQNRDGYEAGSYYISQNAARLAALSPSCQFIEGDFEDYLCKLQDPQWVGEVEINALAVMYKRDFLIYQEPGKPAVNITDNNFVDKVQLCFLNGNHYDSVYPISHIKSTALCQSILYELLYEGVFKVDRSMLGICQRNSRPSDLLSDDSMNTCASSDESDLDTGEALCATSTRHNNHSYRGRGRGRQLPERVRRSLNPTLLRNVEYDVWHKTKRAQQKMDYCIAAGMHFTIGDRCQVRLEGSGRSYNATIKEVPPSNGPVTVYIEELGRKQVPLWSLRPHSDESSWSVVANRDKRLSNGHGGEWEDRGKGRGRGKAVPASPSVSQATAPGSGGRVQTQHSWPPQATVDEQGGPKTSRKSVSSVESAFGLTEVQRLAKEEEERNVALVEIQLRDEHSFPALGSQPGTQGDGGRRKGGEKRRSQRNKTKSPVEDLRAPSPSAGDTSKSGTPPLSITTSTSAPNADTTTPTLPTAPSANPDPTPTQIGSVKASTPNVNMAAAAASGSTSSLPLTCAPPTAKSNTHSYASAAAAPSSPPPTGAPSAEPSVTEGAPPHSVPSSAGVFSVVPPVLPAASSPPTPLALSSSSPPPSSELAASSLPPKSAASPPPSSSVPPPTFIAPIAPIAAQGFPRSSPPISTLPPSPSPPAAASSYSFIHPSAQVQEAPPAPAQTTNSSPKTGGTPTSQTFQSQTSLSQIHPQVPQNQSLLSVSQDERQTQPEVQTQSQDPNQAMMTQTEAPSSLHGPQSCTEVSSLPQTHLQPEAAQIQSSPPHPGASYPPIQPPHPSQVPHPSLSLSASPNAQNPTETPPLPPHPSLQPQLQSPHPPPHPQSIPGTVPLQLSQIYQDPLYPGFPQGEKGDLAPTPPISSSMSGDDLPQDVNIMRFFFNLGVKAYSMPIIPPYLYLLPLQQAHSMHPKLASRSPSPHYLPSNPPTRHQEAYQPAQYPPTSVSTPPQYDYQAPLAELPRPSEPSFNQAGYPNVNLSPLHRMPSLAWQQMPPPRNPSYPVGYPSPPYQVPPSSSQGYHPSQGPGHPLYPPSLPLYPQASAGYQSSSAPEELQGMMERLQAANGDTRPGHGHIQGPVECPAGADVANVNNNRTVMVPSGFAHNKKDPGESVTRAVLLVDPPLNNRPILVADVKDISVSMANMKPSSRCPGSPSLYRGARKPANLTKAYVPAGVPELGQVGYLAEPLSVGCSTEDDWEEGEGFKPPTLNVRGQRRSYRGGGRGRYRRRHGGDMGVGLNYVQFSSSYRGRGREGGY